MRQKPTIASPIVGKLLTGEVITINAIEGNWCRLQNNSGWVSNKYLSDEIVSLEINKIAGSKKGLVGDTDAEKIWNYLYAAIGNEFGVAGLMGNMKAESALKSNNLQQSYERKLGFTDESYTTAVDNGTYTNFVYDKAGYGLVQWTYWSLKEGLYKYAKQ
ncbi:MAG: phage tail-type lysozyme domain-containing protein [Bacillota bacterium]|nr:phage tail-type lysozyme domain-containing protein [Bacillota bacterium]